MTTQPTVYLPHGGGPCFFMDWDPPDAWDELRAYLENINDSLPATPSAIVVISAHWEEPEVVITSGKSPDLVYDYYGFPEHTYQLTYPAPGHPDLAARAGQLLAEAGQPVRLSETAGWDHGVFIPLKLMYPEAKIPVISISLREGLDPATHLAIGAALAPLRSHNALIVGSGMSYHAFGQAGGQGAAEFDDWLHDTLNRPGPERRELLANWASAPGARSSHPREEHLIPLMVCAGAAGDGPSVRTFNRPVMGTVVSAFNLGDAEAGSSAEVSAG